MAVQSLPILPLEVMEQIAEQSDFFTQLYLGSMPCICEYHRWISCERNRGRMNIRDTVLLCKFTIRTWYNRKRAQLRKSNTFFGYWKKKFIPVDREQLYKVYYQTELVAMWRGFAKYTEYQSVRDWKEEGILFMCIDYNLQALNKTPFQANFLLRRRCHLQCFQEEMWRYASRVRDTPIEDFERKKNF